MQHLRNWKDQNVIKVVTGMRRCGKSTLLEMFADELRQTVPEERILFYNFEDLDTLAIGGLMDIYHHITARIQPGGMNYIFLDEPQNIPEFERMMDSLYIKKNVDLYVTGSNARLLSGELATLLTGRYIEISMLPFSFSEYCEAVAGTPDLTQDASLAQSPNKPPNFSNIDSLADYLLNGSIPQLIASQVSGSEQADSVARSILNTVVEKDIFARHTVRNRQAFYKVMDFVMDSVGSTVSPRSIADALKAHDMPIDKETVANYLQFMVDAYLIHRVERFDIKGKHLLQTLNKFYLSDPGFRKVELGKTRDRDAGHMLENAVYLELLRRNPRVFIGKAQEKEVDFVVMDHKGYQAYYQVAHSTIGDKTLERELAPLLAIRDSNPKYLLTTDIDGDPVYDGIRKLNVADWLLDTSAYV
jgi:predicted AAA+ superfamily ATPase